MSNTARGASKDTISKPTLVDKFVLRLPPGLRDQVLRVAAENMRSGNSEFILLIMEALANRNKIKPTVEASREFVGQGRVWNPSLHDLVTDGVDSYTVYDFDCDVAVVKDTMTGKIERIKLQDLAPVYIEY